MLWTRPFMRNPLSPFLLLGLVLGVCFFQLPESSWAQVGEGSTIFSKAGEAQAPSTQPMPLPEETPSQSPDLFSTLVRLFLALAAIVALIFLTVWSLKWVWEKRGWGQLAEEGKSIRVLTTSYLGPRKAIHLVEVGERILVVGVGNDEISCLDVIREPEEVEALRKANTQGFPKVFNRVVQRHETAHQEAETKRLLEESSEAVGGYLAKLKNMKKKKNTPESNGGKS